MAIVCANYNYGRFIVDAMKSIMNQTYNGELRLYVVDDGSSDNSWKLISDYKSMWDETEMSDRVVIKRIENSGASVARITAIKMCWDWQILLVC